MRSGLNWVSDDTVYIMPDFIHEFGDRFHHMSLIRTCEKDEDGAPISGGPGKWRVWIHELLDDLIFYPFLHLIKKRYGDSKTYVRARLILGFFWGLNCGFPTRDIVLYTVWDMRGCKPQAVFKKIDGGWKLTYPLYILEEKVK